MTATPWGFRDILPDEAQAREDIALSVRDCLKAHGYTPIETPLLEDKAALERGGRSVDTPFKLFDDDGGLLVVRPDNTLSIARLVSTRLGRGNLPLRLRYEAPVVREQPRHAARSRQFTQLGFELIGEGGQTADAEVIGLVMELMSALDLPEQLVVCGSVRPFKALLDACGDAVLATRALQLVHANDLIGLDTLVAASTLAAPLRRAIVELPRVHGGIEALERADALLSAAGVAGASTTELRALASTWSALSFDFSLMNSFDYYTGLVVKAYAGGLSDPVGSGGRYDALFDGLSATSSASGMPAAGFAFSLERLAAARRSMRTADIDCVVGRASAAAMPPLRIAVPKGSLKEGSLAALAAAGLDVSGLEHSGRHLIVSARESTAANASLSIGEVEFIIVRAQDAPAFVACGGADCGICGRDSLAEAGLDLLQLVDLGFGECRFVEAEPSARVGAAKRAYAQRGSLRVATKYPRIAEEWYASRGVTTDIVTLHGNIELAPIVGMADRIVDITATGATLAENQLVITHEIMECTARFFVNPGRARLDLRVRELARRLAAVREDIRA